MTKGLLASRSKKILLCKLNLKKPSETTLSDYKTYRNMYAKILKASKKLYYDNQLVKYQSDCKKTWEILRKVINKSKRSDNSITSIISEGKTIYNPGLIANKFNDYISSRYCFGFS